MRKVLTVHYFNFILNLFIVSYPRSPLCRASVYPCFRSWAVHAVFSWPGIWTQPLTWWMDGVTLIGLFHQEPTQVLTFPVFSAETFSCNLRLTLLPPVSACVVPALCPGFVTPSLPVAFLEIAAYWRRELRAGCNGLGWFVLLQKNSAVFREEFREDGGEQISAEVGNSAFVSWERAGFSMLICLYVCAIWLCARMLMSVHSCLEVLWLAEPGNGDVCKLD